MRPPCAQLIFSGSKLVREAGVEPAALGFRSSAQTTMSFSRAPRAPSPAPELNWLPRFTGAAHRPQCLRGPKTGAGGANRTLVSRLPCDGSPIELHRLEPKGGFEPPSERYEGSVFTKLLRLERVTGFEPVSGPWQGPILAARRYPPGASASALCAR